MVGDHKRRTTKNVERKSTNWNELKRIRIQKSLRKNIPEKKEEKRIKAKTNKKKQRKKDMNEG